MAALIYRRAFSDHYGLGMLGRGNVPTIDETRRRIFLAERRTDFGRPDHFYKAYLEHRLGEAKHVGELPWIVLQSLAERYLERCDGRIAVRYELFSEWHELLPFLSPLAIIVAFLVVENRGPAPGEDVRYFLAREIGETAIISASDPGLDDLISRKGLNEMHMHLNGSTEIDVIWPDACAMPAAIYAELKEAQNKHPEASAELYEQLEPGLTPQDFYRRLRAVRRVRRHLVMELIPALAIKRNDGRPAVGLDALLDAACFDLSDMDWPYPREPALSLHPASVLFGGKSHRSIVEEAGFLYACLTALRRDPNHRAIGTGLYFNLLIFTQMSRLAVQQADETGFDQFQKYTLLGMRERIERRYADRFRQLNIREPFQLIHHLEGRFAPKSSLAKTRELIANILEGYLTFRGCCHVRNAYRLDGPVAPCLVGRPCTGKSCRKVGYPNAEFSLVAHFIKRLPIHANDHARGCRDSDLRIALDEQARILRNLIANNETVCSLLQGVDGASNELHASPEPFAPAFRLARGNGIPRATFHVGEDFQHLLSGIRAVAEAVHFLSLRSGDRIGHATALGIDPNLWLARTAPRSVINRMEILDDAVFAYQGLAAVGTFGEDMLRLKSIIAIHSDAIYGMECSPDLLHRAWELRQLDIFAVRLVERNLRIVGKKPNGAAVAAEAHFLAETAVDAPLAAELRLIAKTVGGVGAAYELFVSRHSLDPTVANELVDIDAAMISVDAYAALQDHILGLINERGIALETLPTSNLRISFYNDMTEHHLFRWLGLCGPEITNRPTVCVGSDDPGIFATNLKNEYAMIGSVLRQRFKKTAAEATRILEKLNDNGRVHRFAPNHSLFREKI